MSKISFKFVRMASYIIVLLVALIITLSFKSFQSITDSAVMDSCHSSLIFLRADILSQEENTANFALSLSDSEQLVSGITNGDRLEVEESLELVTGKDGFFAAVSDLDGNVIWKSDNALSQNFSSALSGKTATDLYFENAAMYASSSCPVYYDSSVVGALIVGYDLSDSAIVDNIKEQTGNEITVFGENTRISTTVIDESGNRGVGTKLDGEIYSILSSGNTYTGKTTILDQAMSALYEPLTDSDGEIIGVLFSGKPISENEKQFRNVILLLIGISLLIGIMAVYVLAKVTKQIVGDPVLAIKDKMIEVKSGRLSTPMEQFKRADNETTALADAVEDTVHTLEEYISDISGMLTSMANYDFSKSSEVDYIGDFSAIKDSMSAIETNIRGIVASLQLASERINADSIDISNGAVLLAQGSTEQAATIQELMASITSVSENVSANASNAVNATALSEKVVKMMGEEELAVGDMLNAISEIEDKSTQISKVIKAIEDIAFQTNILALNAAVEAARAGAAGKGFAVVAEEVRTLAVNSAEAAKSTSELIEATISSVHGGTELAKSVAESMTEVKKITDESNNLMEEINRAAAEQADALAQISVGMEQISSVVQQNSYTAEESSASSQKLTEQFNELQSIIAKFKI